MKLEGQGKDEWGLVSVVLLQLHVSSLLNPCPLSASAAIGGGGGDGTGAGGIAGAAPAPVAGTSVSLDLSRQAASAVASATMNAAPLSSSAATGKNSGKSVLQCF